MYSNFLNEVFDMSFYEWLLKFEDVDLPIETVKSFV